MSTTIATRRKNRFNLFREAAKLGSFDEFPMLRLEVDPQIHLSRNEVDQPFHLVCEKDTVIAQFSGASRVLFEEGATRYFDLEPGDYVYVPAGIPHRILTRSVGDVLRYKAREPGVEATLWYCDNCGGELDRHIWDNSDTTAQAGYQEACERHNAEAGKRTCGNCGKVHPPIDLSPFRWNLVAEKLNEDDEDS